jgi:hypothetical protein
MLIAIVASIVVALLVFAVHFVAFAWFNHWVSTLPPAEQEKAWRDYYWLSMAETPEERAMIMEWRRKMKVYLSGSITKEPDYLVAFELWEKRLKQCGYEVVNPTSFPEVERYEDYMKRDIRLLLDCDAIFYVNDTTTSKGAFVEGLVAKVCGIRELKQSEDGIEW